MLADVVAQLEDALNKLDRPSDISNTLKDQTRQAQAQKQKKLESIAEGKAELEEVDNAEE